MMFIDEEHWLSSKTGVASSSSSVTQAGLFSKSQCPKALSKVGPEMCLTQHLEI